MKGSFTKRTMRKTIYSTLFWNSIFLIFVIGFCTAACVYSFSIPFYFDDLIHIVNAPYLLGQRATSYVSSWTYRPLLSLTYWLEASTWGINAGQMRLINIILHLASVLLLWKILTKRVSWILSKIDFQIGLFMFAIFAVHPIVWHSVLYVSARSTLLSAFFIFLTVYLYGLPSRRRFFFLASAVAALLSKEIGLLALPAALIINEEQARLDTRYLLRDRKRRGILLLSSICAILAAFLFRIQTFHAWWTIVAQNNNYPYVWINYVATQPLVACKYLSLYFFPIGWAFIHDIRPVLGVSPALLVSFCEFIAVIILGHGIFRPCRFSKYAYWAALFSFLPEFFYPRELIAIEQRCYVGYGFLTIAFAARLIALDYKYKIYLRLIIPCVVVIFSVLTLNRIYIYRSYISLQAHDIDLYPNHFIFRMDQAEAEINRGDRKLAIQDLQQLLASEEPYVNISGWFARLKSDSYALLYSVFLDEKRLDDAERLLDSCLPTTKSVGHCQYLRAQLATAKGEFKKSIAILNSIQNQSVMASIKYELVRNYFEAGDEQPGLQLAEKTLRETPQNLAIANILVDYYLHIHHAEDAKRVASAAVSTARDLNLQNSLVSLLQSKLRAIP